MEKEKGIWSISNVISLRQDYDECSEGLIKNAIDKGYCKREKDFNFRKCYSDKFMTWAAKGMEREKRSRVLLFQNDKKFILKDFIGILRDHGKGMDSREWSPEKSEASLCLHAKDPLIRRTQTICSMVAKLGQENNFYFTTGASNPCLSPFFPIFLKDTRIPEDYQESGAYYHQNSFWWQSEKFHRDALCNFRNALLEIYPFYRDFEEKMMSSLEKNNLTVNQREINEYFKQARTIVVEWGSRLKRLAPDKTNWFYRNYWHKYNKRNGMI
ncbi:MAG: hypothetical protein PHI72_01980 [Atribacterota bacterium]|nr:hypothetical protein [Atribacterota bacterium]MDD4896468.1 hypothetical protein [Atribacterota bacterium]MDD5637776.1 hypothetical protein [Atribacterota bacterium]